MINKAVLGRPRSGENPLGNQPIGRLLLKFAVPSIIAMLVGALYNIVDQFFIGQKIGVLGNAATNIAFPLSTSCVAIGLLFGIGGAAAFNLAMGAGERERATSLVGNALVMLFGLGTLLAVGTLLFLKPLLTFFGSPDNVLPYAIQYTSITALGFPFLIFSTGGGHLIRADGSPQFAMLCNLSGAVINTILDPIFIFGLDMDMAGAAWATVIGQLFSFGMAVYYFTHYKTVQLKLQHLMLKWKSIWRVASLGAAPAFNQLAMMVVQITMNKSLTYYGAMSKYGKEIPLASVGIISKVAMIFFAVIIGISQGMQPIVSFNYGARKFDRARRAYTLALKSGFVLSLFASTLFMSIPRQIISLFGEGSAEYFAFSVSFFRIFFFFTFINFVQPMSSNFFTAIGVPKKGIFLSLTRQIIFLLPLILIFPLFMGINGIVFAGPIADFIAFLVSVIMIRREFKLMGASPKISPK